MPALPGSSQPLSITMCGGGGRRGKGAGGGGKGNGSGSGGRRPNSSGHPVTPKKAPSKRKGDDELLQIDLKRQRHVIKTNLVACH